MRFLITFLPAVLVPVLAAVVFKRLNWWQWLTFVLTLLILFAYPLVVTAYDPYFNPPDDGRHVRCGTPMVGFIFGFWFMCIPAAMVVQLITNAIVWQWRKKAKPVK